MHSANQHAVITVINKSVWKLLLATSHLVIYQISLFF